MPTVTVRFFASVREAAGEDRCSLTLPGGATVSAARAAIATRFPRVADALARCRLAVNMEFVPEDSPISDGDEVSIIPAVSGG